MAAAATAAAAAIASGAAPAMAAPLADVCASRAVLYDTPGGLVVGVLARGTDVVVLRRSANRRWVRVRTARAITGWTPRKALCD
jgi:hypothetical protein